MDKQRGTHAFLMLVYMTDYGNYQLENVSIAFIDDHEVVLEGFRSYIVKSGITHVEAFSKAQPLLDRIHSHPFDIYIVDVELPDMDACELIDAIRDLQPGAKIIINTMHEEMWMVSKMTEKKVDGVMYKSAQLDQLLEAIIAVINGRQFFCTKFKKARNKIQAHNSLLTRREQEVLMQIAKGLSTKEMSSTLFISENTIETHRQNILSKLKAHNMAELIIKAIAAGYIDPKSVSDET